MTTDEITMLGQQIDGAKSRLSELKKHRKSLQQVAMYQEEIEKIRADHVEMAENEEAAKSNLSDLLSRRQEALAGVTGKIKDRLVSYLPYGEPFVDLEDRVAIGWKLHGNEVLPQSLSGGERVIFGTALCNALSPKDRPLLIVVEAAEADATNLSKLLSTLAAEAGDAQVICNSWHIPDAIPDGWDVKEFGFEDKTE